MTMHDGIRWVGFVGLMGLFVALGLLGCGGNDELNLTPVSGTISTPDGPIVGAGVSFRADASKGNTTRHIPSGATDAAGKYELITGGRKGAPPGWYKVVVTPPSPKPVDGSMPPSSGPPPFAPKYMDVNSTDLRVEVRAAAPPGTYDLKLEKQ